MPTEVENEDNSQQPTTCFVKIDENNVVTQKQPNNEESFIEAPSTVVCGMILNAQGNFESPPADETTLETIKSRAINAVDIFAEQERLKYISPGAGQAMVYQRKVEEADKLVNDANPDPLNYPLLASSIGIEGSTLQEIGELVLATRDQWLQIAALIENIRLSTKRDINEATSQQEIEDIVSSVEWP